MLPSFRTVLFHGRAVFSLGNYPFLDPNLQQERDKGKGKQLPGPMRPECQTLVTSLAHFTPWSFIHVVAYVLSYLQDLDHIHAH